MYQQKRQIPIKYKCFNPESRKNTILAISPYVSNDALHKIHKPPYRIRSSQIPLQKVSNSFQGVFFDC